MFNKNEINIKGDNNKAVQYINNYYDFVFFKVPNVKGFLEQINHRKELDLLNKSCYIPLSFENGKTIGDILDLNKVIIIGNPGSGKTQLLIDIFVKFRGKLRKINLWKLEIYFGNEFLPFFIPLRDLDNNLNTHINEIIISRYNLKHNQKFILLLDGLDEISSEKARDILNFIESNQQHKYIITSRKGSLNLGYFLSRYSDFEKFEIKEFNFDVEKGGNTKILERYFKNRGKEIDLEKYKKLQIEIKDVFYLEQFFEVYEELTEKDGKLELTEKYIKKLSNKNNELLDFKMEENELFSLLEEITSFLYNNSSLKISKKDLEKLIKNFINDDNKKKDFLSYLIKTFFIKSEGNDEYYSFRHKTFYDYLLVRYIGESYDRDKLSIRNGNILLDKEFIENLFYPYLYRKYKKNNDYEKLLGLNLFMYYYDNSYFLIDDIDREELLRALFDLPEDLLRYYIFDKTFPIYKWFNDYNQFKFNYLNFNTIKIAIDKGYKDIAKLLYDKLNESLEIARKRENYIRSQINLLDKNSNNYNFKKHKLEQEFSEIYEGLNLYNQVFIRIYFNKFNSFREVYDLIKNKYEENILDKISLRNNFYLNPYYAFFDELLKYGEEKEILEVVNQLEKKEFYIFLQVGLRLDNINKLLGNKNVFKTVKNKFISYHGNFSEFIYENNDDAITLFLKYIFRLYTNEEEIFKSEEYYELKEGRNGFFDINWGFSEFNLNNNQLVSYLFYKEINLKEEVEKHYLKKKGVQEYRLGYFRRVIYQYSYSLFIDNLLKNGKINFREYVKIIKSYSDSRLMDNLNIKNIYSEILAYIFYYNVDGNYLTNVKLIWDNLYEFVDKLVFYKTISKLDKTNKSNVLKEIIESRFEIEKIEKEINENIDEYFSYKIGKNTFISRLYGLVRDDDNSKNLQIRLFNKALSYAYVRYGFRKEYYLTLVFDIIKELKENRIITEKETFNYIDQIIDLYSIIYGITEKGDNRYLDEEIISFVSQISIDKAEKYLEKLFKIPSYEYDDKIKSIILIQRIKNKIYKKEDVENLFYYYDDDRLLELEVCLYLIDKGEDKYINIVNEIIDKLNSSKSVRISYSEESLDLYKKLCKQGKIRKCNLIHKELKDREKLKKGYEKKMISLNGLTEKEIMDVLNDERCNWIHHIAWDGDYNYLLNELYVINRDLFYKYISKEYFTNFKGLTKVYIKNDENNRAIKLLEELIDFANLLIK